MRHLRYLKYILRHKWYVFVECCRLGIPIRGLLHDMSKFRPSEWGPYVQYFYGGGGNGYEFNKAWLKHIHRNPHHWQHWILRCDDGDTKILCMPQKYRHEMLADWIGAGKAITGKDNLVEWFRDNQEKIRLSQETENWIRATIAEHLTPSGDRRK